MAELMQRYVVMTMATEAPFDPLDPEGTFVLKPWKDPAALSALRRYAQSCYPELANDLEAWITAIEAGPTVRGDVGRRNEPYAVAVVTTRVLGDGAARRSRRPGRVAEPKRPMRAKAAKPRASKPKTKPGGRPVKRKKRSR